MTLHYGFSKEAAERGLLKERREKFKDFKKVYDSLFTKEKQNKWENKVKSKVSKIKKMSPQQIAKLIRQNAEDLDLSSGVTFTEYRDLIKDHVLNEANQQFTSVFGLPYQQVHEIIKDHADSVSELFADRQYAAKMAEMMNRLEYTGDPEKLVESYRRSGDDGMYDFTKEKLSKLNNLLKSDPETYGGQDTVKCTKGFIKQKYISQGYSPKVSEEKAEEECAQKGCPSCSGKLDNRNPNPFSDFNPRNDKELIYNTTEPGSPLDPVTGPSAKDYVDGGNPDVDPMPRDDVGSTPQDSGMRSEWLKNTHRRGSLLNPFKRY